MNKFYYNGKYLGVLKNQKQDRPNKLWVFTMEDGFLFAVHWDDIKNFGRVYSHEEPLGRIEVNTSVYPARTYTNKSYSLLLKQGELTKK